ncbi:hypothetical protein BGW80DRAFT_1340762 [Lactifluus volemus]|nr:hypothetical protein BGW80DRAFT_1340762 [Lactifluus volemus]
MTEHSDVPPTVLSALQATPFPDNITTSGLHTFSASSEKTITFLYTLLETTERVANSVSLHSASAVNDSRTVSLLRQQSAGQHALHLSRTQVTKTIGAAQERRRTDMGVLARVSACSSAAGMQAYHGGTDATAGTLTLGGKVLVLDVTFVPEPTVHVSSAEGRGDGRRLRDALEYLMRLDELAEREGNGGARWFSEVDTLAEELGKITQEEAALLAQFTGRPSVPLDVLLLRGHALALPYLHSPTLCFLVYLSPRAYLSLQRSAPMAPPHQRASFDLPSAHLHSCLGADPPPTGVTRASLNLVPLSQPTPPPTDPLLSHRPSFPLAPTALGTGKYGWVLNFGQGVVMSQSRMLEIARIVEPQDQMPYNSTGPSLSFVTRGWVDMLLNPGGALSSDRYTATYVHIHSL